MRVFILARASLACAAMFCVATVRAQELYVSSLFDDQIDEVNPNGSVSGFATLSGAASGGHACGLALGLNGDVYAYQYGNPATIVQVTPSGATSTIGPTNAGPPAGLTVGANGNIYMPETIYTSNQIVGQLDQMTPSGATSVFATLGPYVESGGIATGPNGDMYISDDEHGAILKVTPTGVVSTLASGLLSGSPTGDLSGIAVDSSGDVFYGVSEYLDLSYYTGVIVEVNEILPNGTTRYYASFQNSPIDSPPQSLAIGPNGTVFATFPENGNVYQIDANGNPSVYATLPNGDSAYGLVYDAAAVPEPSMTACLALGLGVLVMRRRKSH